MRPRHRAHKATSRLCVWLSLAAAGAGSVWCGPAPVIRLQPVQPQQTVARLLEARLEKRGVRWSDEEFSRAVDAVTSCAKTYGYPPEFILGLIDVESGFRVSVKAKDGSVGLVQIKPSTARAICRVRGWVPPPETALHDPGINITLGVAYLNYLEGVLGSREMALAGYNMGEIAARRKMGEGLSPRQSYRDQVNRRSVEIARGVPLRLAR